MTGVDDFISPPLLIAAAALVTFIMSETLVSAETAADTDAASVNPTQV